MILNLINEHISIDELQKKDEKNFVHFLSRPVAFLRNLINWNSVIYTTKSIARDVIIKNPGTLHLFRIIECNKPFDIRFVDGNSCRVTMFENSGLAENLAIYFKGENCTVLYTGCFTRCRALLWNKLLRQYVLKGIDVMYVDNTAARSVDPVSVNSATVEILKIANKYPDHQIIMSIPPFGYEDLIFSLAKTAKLKVFVEGAHLFAFEKHQISEIFEQNSQEAKVIVKEEEVSLDTIAKRFIEEKLITLRIVLCELPPKNYYEKIGLFEVHWSPHPSLFEIYTLINYINAKSVKEIDLVPKLPSSLLVKTENKDNSIQVEGDLSGRSTPVSEIEELSAFESCNTNNQREGLKRVHYENQFETFVRNNIERLHKSAWKYYSLPKRIPRRAKKDHQKNAPDPNVSNDFPSVSTFSSLDFSVKSKTDPDSQIVSPSKTNVMHKNSAVISTQHAGIKHSRKSRKNESVQLISSTPRKGGNAHQAKSVAVFDKEDSSDDIASVSTFSSLSLVESDLNLSGQSNTENAPRTEQTMQTEDKSVKDCANTITNKSKKSTEAHQAKPLTGADKEETQYDFPSVSTFSSLFSSVENDLNLTGRSNELMSPITDAPRTAESIKIGDKSVGDCAKSIRNKTKKNARDYEAEAEVLNAGDQSSHEFPSISTFTSLSTSVERNPMWNDLINEVVSQISMSPSQSNKKTPDDVQKEKTGQEVLKKGDKSVKNKLKKNNKGNQTKISEVNKTKGNHRLSYEFPSMMTSVERNPMWNDLVNEVVSQINMSISQESEGNSDNAQSNEGEEALKSGSQSTKNTSMENERDSENKAVASLNKSREDHQSSYNFPSISTFSSLSSSTENDFLLDDQTNKVMSQMQIKNKSSVATGRTQNQSKKRGQDTDHIKNKQCEERALKHGDKPVRKGKTVRQPKRTDRPNESKRDYLSGSTFSSFDAVNEIISQLNSQKISNNSEHFTRRTEELPQMRRQNAKTARRRHAMKKRVPRVKSTSKKDGNVLEEDAQVVPNVSDEIDSESSEEFNSSSNILFEDTVSVSTFTSLSLSSLSDEIITPDKRRKLRKKKTKVRKVRWSETSRRAGIGIAANDYGQSTVAEEKKSTQSRLKQRASKKNKRGK